MMIFKIIVYLKGIISCVSLVCEAPRNKIIVGTLHNFIAFHNNSNTKNFSGMRTHTNSIGEVFFSWRGKWLTCVTQPLGTQLLFWKEWVGLVPGFWSRGQSWITVVTWITWITVFGSILKEEQGAQQEHSQSTG